MKEEFEKRKENYLRKLENSSDFLELIMYSYMSKGLFKEAEMVLDPKDENQLLYSDAAITISVDLIELLNSVKEGYLEVMPLEENDLTISLIDRMKKRIATGELEEFDINKLSPRDQARMVFCQIIFNAYDPEQVGEYVCKQVGFDTESAIDVTKFALYMSELTNSIKTSDKTGDGRPYDELSETEIENLYEFSVVFDELVRKYCGKSDEFHK